MPGPEQPPTYDHDDETTLIPPRVTIPGEPDPDSSDDETLAGRAKDAIREKAFEVAIDKGGTMLGVPTGIIQAFAGGTPVGIGLVVAAFLMRRALKRKPLRSVGKRVRGRLRNRIQRRRARRHAKDDYDDDYDDEPDHDHHEAITDGYEVFEKKIRQRRPVRTIRQLGPPELIDAGPPDKRHVRPVAQRRYGYSGPPAHFHDDDASERHWKN